MKTKTKLVFCYISLFVMFFVILTDIMLALCYHQNAITNLNKEFVLYMNGAGLLCVAIFITFFIDIARHAGKIDKLDKAIELYQKAELECHGKKRLYIKKFEELNGFDS